jgi:hypothetical protein
VLTKISGWDQSQVILISFLLMDQKLELFKLPDVLEGRKECCFDSH